MNKNNYRNSLVTFFYYCTCMMPWLEPFHWMGTYLSCFLLVHLFKLFGTRMTGEIAEQGFYMRILIRILSFILSSKLSTSDLEAHGYETSRYASSSNAWGHAGPGGHNQSFQSNDMNRWLWSNLKLFIYIFFFAYRISFKIQTMMTKNAENH